MKIIERLLLLTDLECYGTISDNKKQTDIPPRVERRMLVENLMSLTDIELRVISSNFSAPKWYAPLPFRLLECILLEFLPSLVSPIVPSASQKSLACGRLDIFVSAPEAGESPTVFVNFRTFYSKFAQFWTIYSDSKPFELFLQIFYAFERFGLLLSKIERRVLDYWSPRVNSVVSNDWEIIFREMQFREGVLGIIC